MPTFESSATLNSRKKLIAQHFSQAKGYEQAAIVQRMICEQLIDLIDSRRLNKLLEIGAGNGQLTQLLANHVTSDNWVINELTESVSAKLQTIAAHFKSSKTLSPTFKILIADAETSDLGKGYDLIISANAIQWYDNPLRFIAQSVPRLNSGGQLLFNTFTPHNFKQIKELTGQGLDYPPIEAWRQTLDEVSVDIQSFKTYRYDLQFANPYDVLKHIKSTGVSTNTTSEHPFIWSKRRLKDFTQAYWQQFSYLSNKPCVMTEDNNETTGVILTYETLVVSAIKR